MGLFARNRTLNCCGKIVELDRPHLMGILNTAPDSFYQGSRIEGVEEALRTAGRMLEEGADFLDVGGMSTRPGARRIPPEEDAARVVPVIKALAAEFPETVISVDTVYAHTARLALEAGARMVNDISAGWYDPKVLHVTADFQAPYVLMHMQGDPENMQNAPQYADPALEVLDFFIEKSRACYAAGIHDVIIDPGLGFGKSLLDNYFLLSRLEVLAIMELPILIGASRKSMVTRLLDVSPDEALNGTTAVNMIALEHGADILRVHDIRAARECLMIHQAMREAEATQTENVRKSPND